MDQSREVVILSGVRTAVGRYGGSLKDTPPTVLAAAVTREAVSRFEISTPATAAQPFGTP